LVSLSRRRGDRYHRRMAVFIVTVVVAALSLRGLRLHVAVLPKLEKPNSKDSEVEDCRSQEQASGGAHAAELLLEDGYWCMLSRREWASADHERLAAGDNGDWC
jgi:hypothetical protein